MNNHNETAQIENAFASAQPSVAPVAQPRLSVFQQLNEANKMNAQMARADMLTSAKQAGENLLYVATGTLDMLASSIELGVGYIKEELDRQVATRTEAKVESTLAQLNAASKLVAFGMTDAEAIELATSYRV